jgi:uncharacterized small protein (DUF1192 family)
VSYSEDIRIKISEYEERIMIFKRENHELKDKVNSNGQVQKQVSIYENKIALLSQEIERLNEGLQRK